MGGGALYDGILLEAGEREYGWMGGDTALRYG